MSPRETNRTNMTLLREAVLRDCRSGAWRPGQALPPVRDLAQRYSLSATSTQRVLKALAEEGVLHQRHGAGTFVGRLPEQSERAFASIFCHDAQATPYYRAMRDGFEAELGGRSAASVSLSPFTSHLDQLLARIESGALPLGGAFVFPPVDNHSQKFGRAMASRLPAGPRVVFTSEVNQSRQFVSDLGATGRPVDTMRFDDEGGTRQAVRHLWSRGHRSVAFLSLDHPENPEPIMDWPRRRENGFRQLMADERQTVSVFQPDHALADIQFEDQIRAGYQAAKHLVPLLKSGTVTGVVCANSFTLRGMVQALREARLRDDKWPAVVTFDDEADDDHLLSVLRLPWDEVGKAAAVALWIRCFGSPEERAAQPREILVPMRMVLRLTDSPGATSLLARARTPAKLSLPATAG